MSVFALTPDALLQTVRRVACPALPPGVERGARRVHAHAGVFRGGRDGGVSRLAGADRGMALPRRRRRSGRGSPAMFEGIRAVTTV